MTALAEPTRAWFSPSSALALAQYEVRRSASANRPVGAVMSFLRNLGTSPAVNACSGGEAVQATGLLVRPATVTHAAAARPTHELVRALRDSGMPISGIAEVVGVQRKTVYSWLNEEFVADSRNHDRLQVVADLLCKEPQGSLQFLTRHWERQLSDGGTLKEILSAEFLDVGRAAAALEWLRPAVLRSVKQDRHDSRIEHAVSPASSLTEYLEAVTK